MLGNLWTDAVLGTERERGTGDASSQSSAVPSVAPGSRAWTWTVLDQVWMQLWGVPQTCAALGTSVSHGPTLLLQGLMLPCAPIFSQNQDGKQVHHPHTVGL